MIKGRLLKVKAVDDNHSSLVLICVYVLNIAAERMLFLHTLCKVLGDYSPEDVLTLIVRSM